MKNYKILYKNNLLENLEKFRGKKLCAMVKADAYGHGIREIVKLIENEVEYFGVANIGEGIRVRKISDKPILVCSKLFDFRECEKHNLEVIVDDEIDIRKCLNSGLGGNMHLKLDCGMNRFGAKSCLSVKRLNELLIEKDIGLRSICTHFPQTENRKKTFKNYRKFVELRSEISQKSCICFGGGRLITFPFEYDMLRVGLGIYGYGQKNLSPVLGIESYVSKIFYVRKGGNIGYGNKYKVSKDGFYAVVPVGYADGLRRDLSGDFFVTINGQKYKAVGNICMDTFFIEIDENIKIGDAVQILSDAKYFAEKLGTIPYEILTGFSNFRGKTLII